MEVGIFKDGEKITVVIEANYTVTTYKCFDSSMREVAEFIKTLNEE